MQTSKSVNASATLSDWQTQEAMKTAMAASVGDPAGSWGGSKKVARETGQDVSKSVSEFLGDAALTWTARGGDTLLSAK